MNHYQFSDLSTGMKEEFTVTVDQDKMDKFYQITGDANPLHQDDSFAKNQGYPAAVVYGMLTASFLSSLAGVYLPGEKSLIQSAEVKFLQPVFPGDTLRICGEVKELNESVQRMVLKTTIYNQEQRKVLRGEMKIGFLK